MSASFYILALNFTLFYNNPAKIQTEPITPDNCGREVSTQN